jgi:alpha-1,2-mannosyltransferase
MVYYTAARLASVGNIGLLFDPTAFTAYQRALFAGQGLAPLPFAPWLYPPPYLLLILAFSILPLLWSYALFEALSFAAAAVAFAWQRGRIVWWRVLAMIAVPATCATVVVGQNAFLSTALLVGGMRLLDRRPVAAGILFGFLSYKPQLGLMIPFALVAARAWRSLIAAAATAVILVALSLVAFGSDPWRLLFELVLHPSGTFLAEWFRLGFLHGFSIDVSARLAGLSAGNADLMQAIAIMLAGAATYLVYSQPLSRELRLASFLAATMLAAPHLQVYDLLPLALAIIIIFSEISEGRSKGRYHLAILVPAWTVPVLSPFFFGPVAPLIIAAFLGFVISRSIQGTADDPACSDVSNAPRLSDIFTTASPQPPPTYRDDCSGLAR